MMFKSDDLLYFIFAITVVAVVLYIGIVFGAIPDNSCKKENSNIFKKTFQDRYKEK